MNNSILTSVLVGVTGLAAMAFPQGEPSQDTPKQENYSSFVQPKASVCDCNHEETSKKVELLASQIEEMKRTRLAGSGSSGGMVSMSGPVLSASSSGASYLSGVSNGSTGGAATSAATFPKRSIEIHSFSSGSCPACNEKLIELHANGINVAMVYDVPNGESPYLQVCNGSTCRRMGLSTPVRTLQSIVTQ